MLGDVLASALAGFLLGFIGSIPVAGPISAIVVSRGIQGRFRSGVYLSIGAGIAEGAYAALAFWGVSTLLVRYPMVVPACKAAGAVILTVLGITMVRARTGDIDENTNHRDTAVGSFLVGFTVSGLNPTLIATWTAAVTALLSSGVIAYGGATALPFAMGTGVGIGGWFILLLMLIRRYRDRLSFDALTRVVHIIGWGLLVLAVWFAWTFVEFLLG